MDKNLVITFSILVSLCGIWELSGHLQNRWAVERDDKTWAACVGRGLSECVIPPKYDENPAPCPDWLDCKTPHMGSRRKVLISTWRAGAGSGFDYIVIEIGVEDKILFIERRHFQEFF